VQEVETLQETLVAAAAVAAAVVAGMKMMTGSGIRLNGF
jgi:hypothetical protein